MEHGEELWLGTPQTPLNLFVFRVAPASPPQDARGETPRPLAESCGKGGQALGRRASASRRHDKLCLRCVAGARDCASPAVAVADARGAPQRSTNPATTGCPAASADCRRSQPCESRGEWRGHSSGRRVVAASVPTASAQAPSAPQRSTNPATTGCPAARRACAPYHRIDDEQDFVGSTKITTRITTKITHALTLSRTHALTHSRRRRRHRLRLDSP